MPIRAGVRRLFRLAVRRADLVRADADDELRAYVDERSDWLVARGWTPEAARAESLRRLGGTLTQARQRQRRSAERRERTMARHESLDALRDDLRLAARGLRREPFFALTATLILALGIGANAATFGIADRLLLRGPDTVREPHRVMRWYLTERPPGRPAATTSVLPYAAYATVGRELRAFDGVGAYTVRDATAGRGAEARKVRAGYATADLFSTLGVRPALGRFLDAAEDDPAGASRVAVLSHATWRGEYGADSSVLGRGIAVDGETFTVIGVAPAGFNGVDLERVDLWAPLSVAGGQRPPEWRTAWYFTWTRVVGRLRPGVTRERASAELDAAYRRVRAADGATTDDATMSVAPLAFDEEGKEPSVLAVSRWLVGVSAVVLVVACSNVVNLLLARAVRRRREVAVRVALGVGGARLVRMFLVEGLLLAAAGAVAGLAVAYAVGELARRVLLPDVAWTSPPVDARVLGVSVLLALVVGITVGLAPALQARAPSLTAALRGGARDGGGSVRRARLRGALTVAQTALSFLLLVGAGLFARSVWKAHALDLGFQPERVLAVSVVWPALAGPPEARQRERARRRAFMADALERARRLPGVERASLVLGLPFSAEFGMRPRVPGLDSIPRRPEGGPYVSAVTADYFATVGTPLVGGRAFTAADRAGSERVAIVSRTMADALWPGRDPLGRCMIVGGDTMPCTRVVGVAGDTRRSALRQAPAMHYYLPLGQETRLPEAVALLVRPAGDPARAAGALRGMLLAQDPALGYVDTRTLQALVDPQTRAWRLGAAAFGACGLLALAVAALGLYSLVAYAATQRAREIAVRVALGASPGRAAGLVMREGIALAAAGVVGGAAAALVAGHFVAPLLFETSPRDPAVFAAVGATLLGVALLAGAVPARRARSAAPLDALRAE